MDSKFILDEQIVPNSWQYYAEIEEIDGNEDINIFINYSIWQSVKNRLTSNLFPVLTDEENEIPAIWDSIHNLTDIGILFAHAKSGIGYSTARILREEYSYTGNLHALGEFGYDTLCFMHRCGINAFHLNNMSCSDEALKYLQDIDFNYQR
jgi:uncharacterized protein (DUF934 family)